MLSGDLFQNSKGELRWLSVHYSRAAVRRAHCGLCEPPGLEQCPLHTNLGSFTEATGPSQHSDPCGELFDRCSIHSNGTTAMSVSSSGPLLCPSQGWPFLVREFIDLFQFSAMSLKFKVDPFDKRSSPFGLEAGLQSAAVLQSFVGLQSTVIEQQFAAPTLASADLHGLNSAQWRPLSELKR